MRNITDSPQPEAVVRPTMTLSVREVEALDDLQERAENFAHQCRSDGFDVIVCVDDGWARQHLFGRTLRPEDV